MKGMNFLPWLLGINFCRFCHEDRKIVDTNKISGKTKTSFKKELSCTSFHQDHALQAWPCKGRGGQLSVISESCNLVLIGCVPCVVVGGGVISILMAKMSTHGQVTYIEAGNVIDKTVGAFKTVVGSDISMHRCIYCRISSRVIKGDIELKDVYFRYPVRPDMQIFVGFSLFVPSGTTTALVGQSGSGKFTVICLLERFYDPDAGEVLIDGVNLNNLQLKWIRDQIAFVSQEPILFTTTIRDNIAYGKEGTTDEEITAAKTLANARKFIDKLPQALTPWRDKFVIIHDRWQSVSMDLNGIEWKADSAAKLGEQRSWCPAKGVRRSRSTCNDSQSSLGEESEHYL